MGEPRSPAVAADPEVDREGLQLALEKDADLTNGVSKAIDDAQFRHQTGADGADAAALRAPAPLSGALGLTKVRWQDSSHEATEFRKRGRPA